MKKGLFSPGKLMLTSEYGVLDGALALALPTRLGQEFFYEEFSDSKHLMTWTANHENRQWLKVVIDYFDWSILETNNLSAAEFIVNVLKNVQKLSSTKFVNNESYSITTNLQFPPTFGLGSSSTLLNNLAMWSNCDPYLLNDVSLGGSGYDIAVAEARSSILYQIVDNKKHIRKVQFNPIFKGDLIFVHLNQKQDSREGINLYKSKNKSVTFLNELSNITHSVLDCKSLEHFSMLMKRHEVLVSQFIGLEMVKDRFFIDCPVFVKSLGAWGGDFVLSAKFENYHDYFANLGFATIIDYERMIADL